MHPLSLAHPVTFPFAPPLPLRFVFGLTAAFPLLVAGAAFLVQEEAQHSSAAQHGAAAAQHALPPPPTTTAPRHLLPDVSSATAATSAATAAAAAALPAASAPLAQPSAPSLLAAPLQAETRPAPAPSPSHLHSPSSPSPSSPSPPAPTAAASFEGQWSSLSTALRQPDILWPVAFLFVLGATPSADSAMFYFMVRAALHCAEVAAVLSCASSSRGAL